MTQIRANQNCGEFLWCIQNCQDKRKRAQDGTETKICSEPFYSHKNGYKIRLELNPDGFGGGKGTHLTLFICIMRGEFDNILQWPFRHGVKLELMNQETGLAHVSRTVESKECPTSSSWVKPVSERNISMGYLQFIKLSELSSNAGLCLGDQIKIKATPQINT